MQNGAINFTNYSLLEAPQNQDFIAHLPKYVENTKKEKRKPYWNLKKTEFPYKYGSLTSLSIDYRVRQGALSVIDGASQTTSLTLQALTGREHIT